MNLNSHLIYFDITNVCDAGCDFCMYREGRKNPERLQLDTVSSLNVYRLINHPGTDCIVISGEGEPFSNENALKQILDSSIGGKKFQIITNGLWKKISVPERFHELNKIAKKNGDQYTVRLSIDSYHASRIGFKRYEEFFDFVASSSDDVPNVSLAVRSLIEDKTFTRRLISKILKRSKMNYELREICVLEDELHLNNTPIKIQYKNLVNPYKLGRVDCFKLGGYTLAIGNKYGKLFTLGNLNTTSDSKGLNLTVKPNGNVFFYGAEIHPYGNIFTELLDIERFEHIVSKDPFINALYTVPFNDLIEKLREIPGVSSRIDKINNPYWIIKDLYRTHKEEMSEIFRMFLKENQETYSLKNKNLYIQVTHNI